jgi:hypothetical protein
MFPQNSGARFSLLLFTYSVYNWWAGGFINTPSDGWLFKEKRDYKDILS